MLIGLEIYFYEKNVSSKVGKSLTEYAGIRIRHRSCFLVIAYVCMLIEVQVYEALFSVRMGKKPPIETNSH